MSDLELLHALHVPFDRAHMLINRTQCATSVFAADVEPRDSDYKYYHELIRISGFTLRLLDLQQYLCDTFHLSSSVPAQLILITPLERLSERAQEALITGPLEGFDQEQLAMRVSSDTAMRSLHVSELRSLGITMRKHLVAHGLVAAHPQDDSFGFLIDLDRLVRFSAEIVAA